MTDPLPTVTGHKPRIIVIPPPVAASFGRLTLDWLRRNMGKREVQLEKTDVPIYHPAPWIDAGRYPRSRTTLAEALDLVAVPRREGEPWTYLSSVSIDPDLLSASLGWPPLKGWCSGTYYDARFFIGAEGTGSSLHFDITKNILLVLSGSKEVRMYPSTGRPRIAPYPSGTRLPNYAARADALDAVEAAGAKVTTFTVGPGQALYIPSGWWHEVINHGTTLGLALFWKPDLTSYLRCPNCRHVLISTLRTGRYL